MTLLHKPTTKDEHSVKSPPAQLPAFHEVAAVPTEYGFTEFVVTDDDIRVHNFPTRFTSNHQALAVAQALYDSVLARIARAETGEWT